MTSQEKAKNKHPLNDDIYSGKTLCILWSGIAIVLLFAFLMHKITSPEFSELSFQYKRMDSTTEHSTIMSMADGASFLIEHYNEGNTFTERVDRVFRYDLPHTWEEALNSIVLDIGDNNMWKQAGIDPEKPITELELKIRVESKK